MSYYGQYMLQKEEIIKKIQQNEKLLETFHPASHTYEIVADELNHLYALLKEIEKSKSREVNLNNG